MVYCVSHSDFYIYLYHRHRVKLPWISTDRKKLGPSSRADACLAHAMQSRPPAEATWAELPRENAQVQDIALYKRERAVHQGSLIAVNANYTCYAIRGACAPATAQAGLPRPHNHALA